MLFLIILASGMTAAAVTAYYMYHNPSAETRVDFFDGKTNTQNFPVPAVATPKHASIRTDSNLSLMSCCVSSAGSTSKKHPRSRRTSSLVSTIPSAVPSQMSVCDCRTSEDSDIMVRDDESVAMSVEELRFKTAHTKIMPIQFNRYTPLDLTKMTEDDMQNGLSYDARQENLSDMRPTILTPFRPILNSVVYSAKHAFLLSELAKEYEYTDN